MAELKVKGIPIGTGSVVAIKGERGRFVFLYPTWSRQGRLSLTFVGGPPGHVQYRSFRPDRVRKVFSPPAVRRVSS